MGKRLAIVLFILSISSVGHAQLLRVYKAKNIDFSQGFNPYGVESSLGFGYSLSRPIRLKMGMAYGYHQKGYSKFHRFQPHVSFYYNLYSMHERIFFDGYAALKGGVQVGSNRILGTVNDFYVGESLGLSMEYIFYSYLTGGFYGSKDFYQLNRVNSHSFTLGLFVSYNF